MTFWIGAPLSKWRSYEVRLWAKNAPLRCIIVSKNAPKFLIKPEAPYSKSLHKPLVSRDQGERRDARRSEYPKMYPPELGPMIQSKYAIRKAA